ncbi:MAG: rhomboid family intramembrane serine protease [Oscillatoriales cyanobacterium RM2_1_1]|nr:rhomboid family intramembrane serine protease [Oscillatoriales cyanobacterium SM2_3_0]NJO46410.1 rhomboid family intramembrane serine protease [Oscillatoriales cyanobacterium RM2_1_1]
MVPIRDENPVTITPWVTWGLILVNVICFIAEIRLSSDQLELFLYNWAFVPCQLTNQCSTALPISPWPEWITLITSQFLHGGFGHIAGNMIYLAIFGNNVEDCLGHFKFLFFYLTCGVLAALTQGFFAPDSVIPTLGASGAIAGVLGAYIIRFPRAKITMLPLPLPIPIKISAFFFLGFWFVMQFASGVASFNVPANTGSEGGVAYWAHAGGFIFGVILGPLLGLFSNRQSRS